MKKNREQKKITKIPEGTHVWDDDLYELKTPLPAWWIISYLISVAVAIFYWVLYPAWPGISDYSKGILGWSSHGQLQDEIKYSAKQTDSLLNQIGAMPLDNIYADKNLHPVIFSIGKSIFLTRCSKCHGDDGTGRLDIFPSLVDDIWIHGESLQHLYKIISNGKINKMPGHKKKLSKEEIVEVAEYVYSLTNKNYDKALAEKGMEIFNGDIAECYFCHGENASGDHDAGGPGLADSMWIYGGTREKIIETITLGRIGIMPGWKNSFSEAKLKILAVYVKLLTSSLQK